MVRMGSYLYVLVAVCLGWQASIARAAEENPSSVTATAPPVASDTKIIGMLDLRPSYTSKLGEFHTENTLEAGYQFSKNFSLTYVQFVNTNIYDARTAAPGQLPGLGVDIQDGFFRTRVNNIWESADKNTNFSIQGRVYTPTYAPKRDAGFLTTLRTNLKLTQKVFGGAVDLIFADVPMFHAYSKAGVGKKANPIFENMVVLEADVHITKGLTLMLPFLFQHVKNRSFAGATNSGTWAMTYWVWPELDYDVNDNLTLGVAWYSGNFVKEDLSATDFAGAFKDGVAQFVVTVSL